MAADSDMPRPAASGQSPGGKDFRRLRDSGEHGGASLAIGARICAARDVVARGLLAIGATPNRVTVAGFLITCGAAWCLALGASHQLPGLSTAEATSSWWPLWAALLLLLAGASDMLDGAVARVGNLQSRFGAILDSTLDRFCDIAIFLGCALHFALIGNLTLQMLAIVALADSFLISYVKARAEDIIDDCSVGYWLRGERFAAVLIGCSTGHVIAVVWQLAVLNCFTVWRRLDYTRRVVHAVDTGGEMPAAGPDGNWWGRFQLWRHPRGSIPYDIVTGTNIAFIVVAPLIWPALAGHGGLADPLRAWLIG